VTVAAKLNLPGVPVARLAAHWVVESHGSSPAVFRSPSLALDGLSHAAGASVQGSPPALSVLRPAGQRVEPGSRCACGFAATAEHARAKDSGETIAFHRRAHTVQNDGCPRVAAFNAFYGGPTRAAVRTKVVFFRPTAPRGHRNRRRPWSPFVGGTHLGPNQNTRPARPRFSSASGSVRSSRYRAQWGSRPAARLRRRFGLRPGYVCPPRKPQACEADRSSSHLDMALFFYVSSSCGRRPELRGLPVSVAGTVSARGSHDRPLRGRRYGGWSALPASRARPGPLWPRRVFFAPAFTRLPRGLRASGWESSARTVETSRLIARRGLPRAHRARHSARVNALWARRSNIARGFGCSIGIRSEHSSASRVPMRRARAGS